MKAWTPGEVQLRRQRNEHTLMDELHIDHADPTTMVINEVLTEAWSTPNHPWLDLLRPEEGHGSTGHAVGEYDCWARAGRVCFHGSILTIKAVNRTVVYRILDYDFERDAWSAIWPD